MIILKFTKKSLRKKIIFFSPDNRSKKWYIIARKQYIKTTCTKKEDKQFLPCHCFAELCNYNFQNNLFPLPTMGAKSGTK
jgi:hypothetical protein